jgi:hypothetical protein
MNYSRALHGDEEEDNDLFEVFSVTKEPTDQNAKYFSPATNSKSLTLMVIDFQESMFANWSPSSNETDSSDNEDEESILGKNPKLNVPFHRTMKVICQVMQDRAVEAPEDRFGILLYNVDRPATSVASQTHFMQDPSIYLLLDVGENKPENILCIWEYSKSK